MTAQAEHVPAPIKWAHGLGAIAYGIKDNGFSVFLLIFYNQVIGLDAGIVGAAIMIALIVDAFADPFIGQMTDRTRTRWGRRLPWLYGAAIPLGLAWMLLWHPPSVGQAGMIAWLIGTAIIVRALVSCCEVPSVALVPELTRDYHERTLLMRFRFLFGWGGGLLLLILSYRVFLVDGVTARDGYGGYALFGALAMTLSVMASAALQHRYILKVAPSHPPATDGHSLRQMRETLSNRAFLWLVGAALFAFINQGMTFSFANYLLAFVWRMTQAQMGLYAILLFISVIAAFLLVGPWSHHFGKKKGAMIAAMTSITLNSALYACYVADWMPMVDGKPSIAFVFALVFLSNGFAVMLMILSSSMMADVVEASELETGRRSEGLFFAGYFLMQKCANGIGIFIAGQILARSGFPPSAVPGQVNPSILNHVAISYAIAVLIAGVCGIMVLRHFPLSRETHEARVAALAKARQTNDSP